METGYGVRCLKLARECWGSGFGEVSQISWTALIFVRPPLRQKQFWWVATVVLKQEGAVQHCAETREARIYTVEITSPALQLLHAMMIERLHE